MNFLFVATFLCLGALAAASDDGQWKGEGLLESQDLYGKSAAYYGAVPAYTAAAYSAYPAVYAAYAPAHNDGQWKGEGLLESQDFYGKSAAYYGAVPAYGAYAPGVVAAYSAAHDGQWKGEGLLESQDHYGKAYAYVPAYAGAAYAPAAYTVYGAQLAHGGQYLQDTPEVAHAKAQHFAAKAAATHY